MIGRSSIKFVKVYTESPYAHSSPQIDVTSNFLTQLPYPPTLACVKPMSQMKDAIIRVSFKFRQSILKSSNRSRILFLIKGKALFSKWFLQLVANCNAIFNQEMHLKVLSLKTGLISDEDLSKTTGKNYWHFQSKSNLSSVILSISISNDR